MKIIDTQGLVYHFHSIISTGSKIFSHEVKICEIRWSKIANKGENKIRKNQAKSRGRVHASHLHFPHTRCLQVLL